MTKFEELLYANLKAELNIAVAAKPTEAIIKRINWLYNEMKKLRGPRFCGSRWSVGLATKTEDKWQQKN